MFERLQNGDLTARLPPPPEPEWGKVRNSLDQLALWICDSQEKLREKDFRRRRLFGDLTHELGTPVMAIGTISEMLEDQPRADFETVQKLAKMLSAEASRLEKIVHDVRTLTQVDDPDLPLQKETTDLNQLAKGVCEHLGVLHQTPAIQYKGTPVVLLVDGSRIEQVLVNLVRNAQKYASKGNVISVSLGEEATHVLIAVDDDGPGVSEEIREKLGARWWRAASNDELGAHGSGLGLSIVRAIVEKHGGTIQFQASTLGGLRVEVRLPKLAGQSTTAINPVAEIDTTIVR